MAWLTVFEAYADCHPHPSLLARDLVRTRSEAPDHPELSTAHADPGIESRSHVLYHGLMHSGNHLTWEDAELGPMRHSTGVPTPHHPRSWLKEARHTQDPELPLFLNSGRVSERDEDLHSC